jgi:CrcB protein
VWQKLAWLAVAGALGTLARFGLSGLIYRLFGSGFPWGTIVVNVVGCFLFGIVWVLAEDRFLISGQTRLIILTGFMGAFTTFSTFAFETAQQMRDADWLLALANIALQNVVGIVCVFLGFALGRWLF